MHVASEITAFTADNQRDFGVGLQIKEPVDDLGASPFQIPGPANIGFLIKAGFKFNQRGDGFSGFRRFNQSLNYRRVRGSPIQSVLDCYHIGICGCLTKELHHHIEAFIRMMNDKILHADGIEDITASIPYPLRITGFRRIKHQVRPFLPDKLRNGGNTKDAVNNHDGPAVYLQLFRQEINQMIRRPFIHLQADNTTPAAALESAFKQADQIFSFFFDLDITVPDQPEHSLTVDTISRKQLIQEQGHCVLQGDIADLPARKADKASHGLREQQKRLEFLILLPGQLQDHAETQILDKRKWMGRINGHGCENGKDLFFEVIFEPGFVIIRKLFRPKNGNILGFQFCQQIFPDTLLFIDQFGGLFINPVKSLGRGQPVVAQSGNLCIDLPP